MSPTRGIRLRSLRRFRFSDVLDKVLESPWPAKAQRLGSQALERVTARFPAIAQLIDRGERSLRGGLAATLLDRVGVVWPRRAPEEPDTADSSGPPSGVVRVVDDRPRTPEAALDALRRGLAELDWRTRADAIVRWGAKAGGHATPSLIESLDDPSAEVAAGAAEALGQLAADGGEVSKDEVSAALRRVLTNAEGYYSPVSRAAAAQALARSLATTPALDEAALETLGAAIVDVDAEVSLAAIAALTDLHPEEATRHLMRLLHDGSGYFLPTVRRSAAAALVEGGACDRSLLAALLARELDATVRATLEGALSNL